MASESPLYGHYSFLPVGAGFLLGALFVVAADVVMPKVNRLGYNTSNCNLLTFVTKQKNWPTDEHIYRRNLLHD